MKRTPRLAGLAGPILALMTGAIGLPALAAPDAVKLYKNPSCGCCESYADYLRDNGYKVDVVPTETVVEQVEKMGIPAEIQGCHTVVHGDYAVSGHIPVETLRAFLAEAPEATGLTLPGMPAGSPGMGGKLDGPLEVLVVKNGSSAGKYTAPTGR